MSAYAQFGEMESGGTLRFTGDLSLARIGDLPARLDALPDGVKTIDLSDIDRIDTVGAWVIHRFARDRGASVVGLGEDAQYLFDQVAAAEQPMAPMPKPQDPF